MNVTENWPKPGLDVAPPPFRPPLVNHPLAPSSERADLPDSWDIPPQSQPEQRPPFTFRVWSKSKTSLGRMLRGNKAVEKEVTLWSELLEEAPSWVVSVVVHFGIVVVLGLGAAGVQKHIVESMDVELAPAEDYSQEAFAESLGSQLEKEMPGPILDEFQPLYDPSYSMSDLPAVDDPLAAPPLATDFASDGDSLMSAIEAPSIGLALKGRQEGFKEALIAAYGGTQTTQGAVGRSLAWIARQQQRDGTWSLRGPYKNGGHQENKISATAMALLAFLGDGQTHVGEHLYRINVQRGLRALLKFQGPDGEMFTDDTAYNHRLYTHAQCTIALCELYALTKDSLVREAAAKAIDYCVEIQSPQGGWRYFPGEDSDMSVTGWFVMALQSARMANFEVPQETLYRVEAFLDSVSSSEQSAYSYMPQTPPTVAMTAEALLCRQYLGWKREDRRLVGGIFYLAQNPVDWQERDVYYWYYATQVMHHMGGESWVDWNKVMRQVVPEHQVASGRERGSWNPADDRWGSSAGRLYTTCLSTYMLEVYYRHLPLYGNDAVAAD